MNISVTNHAKMRAVERVKEINNWEKAISFIKKEFKNILNEYKNWFKVDLKNMDKNRYCIQNPRNKFIYKKIRNKYIIITYYDNTEKKKKECSQMMRDIRRHMRELNWVYGYNKSINNY